ncbi:MAG: hypothetical protein Gaeavirus3_26 [Gaeavirus sp.]|uniref:Uncharacterized protein n=1 Tax=Gaeavirus sp. TaxID=2487767 RepID=A0A3G4ZYK2_9VIRU|nr:MAG: hypothetical protein Gaeavirus3_26 [Gaeavirus sp.]
MTEERVRNVTGYIHYNEDDDLTKIFDTLTKFRKEHGLKYSHHKNFIFFLLKSDCLEELVKFQPFRISHYHSKSEYPCDKTDADKLLAVLDSFVRMSWNEETERVEFLSRTLGRIHNKLVRRIFETGGIEYDNDKYMIIRTRQSDEDDGGQRAPRPPREFQEHRAPRPPREFQEHRAPRPPREPRAPRESQEHREPRESQEHREPRESQEHREPRAPRELMTPNTSNFTGLKPRGFNKSREQT